MGTDLLLPILSGGKILIIKFTVDTKWLRRYLAVRFKKVDKFVRQYTSEDAIRVYNKAKVNGKILREESVSK